MRLHLLRLLRVKRFQYVCRDHFKDMLVHASITSIKFIRTTANFGFIKQRGYPSNSFKRAIPSRMRVFTVPSGSPV
jgi:hypothetical protein